VDGSVSRASRVIVLAEDARQQNFIRRYLHRLNFGNRDIAFEPVPAGRGCGEQWVRENYARMVRACRDRNARAETAVVVSIDADAHSSEDRARELAEALQVAALAARGPAERIAHLIPRRQIETWILCLTSEVVDEETDYHRRDVDNVVKVAAETLFEWSRRGAPIPAHCVPSLQAAIPEVQRLE
jgi:hypothetical protein